MEREALKLALEAMEYMAKIRDCQREAGYPLSDADKGLQKAIAASKAALAQPEQEPWRESASDYERGVIDGRQKQAQSSVDKAVNRMAQRTWVGLTDGVMCDIAIDHGLMSIDWIDFARAIEAKLKERNA